MTHKLLLIIFLISFIFNQDKPDKEKEENITLNTHPPEWTVSDWLNSKPLTINELQGNVLLIRWWTGPTCPYCINSAVALNEFYETYKNEGLEVLGFYHHKSRKPLTVESVKEMADDLGFTFPVAIDTDWKTLTDWWLRGHRRGWTSVTFLIDQKGIIRHIHPGGKYVKGDQDYAALKQAIETLLAEGKD